MKTKNNISFNLEATREDLQRHIVHLENERGQIIAHNTSLQKELELQQRRTDYEKARYGELEVVLNKERLNMEQFEKENERLRSEVSGPQSCLRSSAEYDDSEIGDSMLIQ